MDVNPKEAGFSANRLERITGHLNTHYVEPGKITGCQVMVARHGVPAYFRYFGRMDRERDRPMMEDTIFRIYSMTKPIRLEHLKPCIDWWGGTERKGRKETERAWKVTADEIKARGYNLDVKNPHTAKDDHGDPKELLAQLNAAEAETASLREQLKTILAEALTR